MSQVNNNTSVLSKQLMESAELRKMKATADESGLLMLEQAFTDQLQGLYDDEDDDFSEYGGGFARELMPILAQEALRGSPHLGVGKEILKDMMSKAAGIGG